MTDVWCSRFVDWFVGGFVGCCFFVFVSCGRIFTIFRISSFKFSGFSPSTTTDRCPVLFLLVACFLISCSQALQRKPDWRFSASPALAQQWQFASPGVAAWRVRGRLGLGNCLGLFNGVWIWVIPDLKNYELWLTKYGCQKITWAKAAMASRFVHIFIVFWDFFEDFCFQMILKSYWVVLGNKKFLS